MPLTLLIRADESSTPQEVTFDAPRIVIGRSQGSDLCLPDPTVSHRHASIRQRGSDYLIMDEGSTNGTFVGPVRLSAGAPRVVVAGDTIRVGKIWLEARFTMNPPTPSGTLATKEIALKLLSQALAIQGEAAAPIVRVGLGPDLGKTLTISEFHRPYVLGRVATADLVLDDIDASRRHLAITRKGDQLWIQDLASKNGSHLADEALPASVDVVWPNEAALIVGGNTLSYIDPVREAWRELEHVPDEPLAMADAPAPPAAPLASGQAAKASVSQRLLSTRPSPRSKPNTGGWGMGDFLVALLAIAVLGISGLGLYWLLAAP
jgi:pSer/pThr/pTyr-binding forkhead associated (FHA) protein